MLLIDTIATQSPFIFTEQVDFPATQTKSSASLEDLQIKLDQQHELLEECLLQIEEVSEKVDFQ